MEASSHWTEGEEDYVFVTYDEIDDYRATPEPDVTESLNAERSHTESSAGKRETIEDEDGIDYSEADPLLV